MSEMNRGRARRDMAFLAVVLIAFTVYYFFFAQGSPAVSFSAENRAVAFTGANKTSAVFSLDDVTSIELWESEDPDWGTPVDGGTTTLGGVLYGTWKNDRIGTYQAFVSKGIKACVIVSDGGKTAAFNTENAELTRNFYQQLHDFWTGELTQATDTDLK